MKTTEIVIQYEGKNADSGRLDLFDAAESLHGFTRVLNRIAHAFSNNDDVRSKVPKPLNVKTFMTGAKKGRFETLVEIEFSEKIERAVGSSVLVKNFWDYFTYTFALGVGVEYEPSTPYVTRKIEKNEEHFDELAATLEGYLAEIHRPIKSNEAKIINIIRPRVGVAIILNNKTLEYVGTTVISNLTEEWQGNVTKYNILTGYGRAYIDDLGKTVPFNLLNFDDKSSSHTSAAASIEEGARMIGRGKRIFSGNRITNSSATIKRLSIQNISEG